MDAWRQRNVTYDKINMFHSTYSLNAVVIHFLRFEVS
jgi:hypothetical protein